MLTEHRQFDHAVSYDALAEQYEVVVLRGAELETEVGHVLVYGISEEFSRRFDLSSVFLPSAEIFRVARDTGGFAVGAHAGTGEHRTRGATSRQGYRLDGVEAVETLNGGSSDAENALGLQLAQEHGLGCVGGSDAHYVSAIGRCMTAFARPVPNDRGAGRGARLRRLPPRHHRGDAGGWRRVIGAGRQAPDAQYGLD